MFCTNDNLSCGCTRFGQSMHVRLGGLDMFIIIIIISQNKNYFVNDTKNNNDYIQTVKSSFENTCPGPSGFSTRDDVMITSSLKIHVQGLQDSHQQDDDVMITSSFENTCPGHPGFSMTYDVMVTLFGQPTTQKN